MMTRGQSLGRNYTYGLEGFENYDFINRIQEEKIEKELERIRRAKARKQWFREPTIDEMVEYVREQREEIRARLAPRIEEEMQKIQREIREQKRREEKRKYNEKLVRKGIKDLLLPKGTVLSARNRRVYFDDVGQIVNDYCNNCTKTENCTMHLEFEYLASVSLELYKTRPILSVEYMEKGEKIKKFYCIEYKKKKE